MRNFNLFSILFSITIFMITSWSAASQIEVTATGGDMGPTTYTTLKLAFDAINAGTHTGTINIAVVGNTTETAPAVLNASGVGPASYTSIMIQPSGGAARTISGAIAGGSPLIDFNGADNVTIDGLDSGGNSLTISNTTVSGTSNTSTIRFINGATNNTITKCNVQGSGTMNVATNGAVIFFSTDASTANGNDNNTISNCNIGPSSAGLPTKGILGNGSTSTTAIGNSNITITNNNIFDYFGAAVTSAGIAINGGCNTWTITDNRFYQTSTRNWSTGAEHNAILLNSLTGTSGVQGMTVTGNIIGYATSSQTGVYTLTGSTGIFRGIRFNGITGGTVSNISNNTIASVSLTSVSSSGVGTSSPFSAIIINNGLVNTNNNTIGSQSATGSLVFSTNTTSATDVYGVYNFSSDNWTSNSNNIGGISVTNTASSGTFIIYGMRANTSTSKTWTATSNNIGGTVANSIQLSATGPSSQVVGMVTNLAAATFTSNTIRNMTTNIGTGTNTSASMIGMMSTTTITNHTFSQNTIHTLHNSNTTAATVVTGIQFTGGTSNIVERNLIYNLTSATNSTTAEINGIRIGGGTTTYLNNMIALGEGVSNAIGTAPTNSSTTGIVGINEALGTNNIWHNSIYIGGTATAGSGPSFAFNGVQIINTRSFRDNIFFNARTNSGGTGSHYAVKINGTAPNPTGLTINNNIYYITGTGGVFGFFNSANVPNLTAWQTAVGQDASSIFGDPAYNDPTASTPDLHIHPTNPSVAEGNGFDLGVTGDFDGETRSTLTPVDIGADAGNFVGADVLAPAISYTPLGNTSCLLNRTFTAIITDASGVNNTAGTKPRLYFKKSTDANTFAGNTSGDNGWKFVEATNATSPFSFTTDYSLLQTPVTTGDQIQYFVVAQDLAATPNVGINSGTFAATPTSVALTPAAFPIGGTINSYTLIAPGLSGTVTIGASGTYLTLTGVGGLFAAINTSGLSGDLMVDIIDAAITEPGTNALNAINYNGCAAGPYNVLIKPQNPGTVLTGSVASGALIRLIGADNVTIDGSTSGGTDKNLTITNSATAAPTAIWISSLGTGAGAENNTVKNCIINANAATSATATGISVSGTTINSAGADNDNTTIQNNTINTSNIGVYANGSASTSTGGLDNLNITENIIAATSTAGSLLCIQIGNALSPTISLNSINGTTSAATTPVGISIETGVTNAIVSQNIITQMVTNNPGGFGGRGITVGTGSSSSNITLVNNMIAGVNGSNWSSFGNSSAVGICIGVVGNATALTTTVGGVNIYYNSVSMTGSMGTGSTTAVTTAIYIGSGASTLNIRNNIFSNTQVGTATGQKNYAIYSAAAASAYLNINYNDYFVSNTFNPPSAHVGFLASDRTTLANWQAASTQDANSVSILPIFVSPTDLHLVPASNVALNNLGIPISGITTDIDGDMRNATTPDMGADEFTPPVCSGAMAGTASASPTGPFCGSGSTTVSSTGYSTGINTTYLWQSASDMAFTSPTDIGSPSPSYSNLSTGTISTTTYYRLKVACSSDMSEDFSNVVAVVINPLPSATINYPGTPYCKTGSASVVQTGTPGGSYTASPVGLVINSSTGEIDLSASSIGTYTVTYSFTDGICPNTTTASVTINPLPSPITFTPDPVYRCTSDVTTQIMANGGFITGVVNLASGTINLAIPDNSATGVNHALTVSGVPSGSTIDSVIVTVNVNHLWIEDVEINLEAPNGQIVNLVADRGGSGDNFVNTRITSDISLPSFSAGAPPFTGTFRADLTPATSLIGLPAVTTTSFYSLFSIVNGNWRIWAYDDDAAFTGILVDWSIKIAYTAPTDITWTPVTSLFNDAGGTSPYLPGTPTATVYTNTPTMITYTATATSASGCTSTANVVVNIALSPDTPTLVADENPACPGNTVTFTAGNGSQYEFFVNAVSQGPPSRTNTYSSATLMHGDVVKVTSYSPFTIDGNITETKWGSALATSIGGPPPGFGINHEINALYLQADQNNINIGLAGNVVFGNRILLFIDSKTGGYSDGNFGRAGAPAGVSNFNSGTLFDAGFSPDYCLVIGTNMAGDNNFFDLYTLTGTAVPSVGGGPNTYLGDRFTSFAGAVTGADPLSADLTRGFEVVLPKGLLGYTGGPLTVMAMYISDGGFLSNQFLTHANPTDGNYGGGPVDFNLADPNPVNIPLSNLQSNCTASAEITMEIQTGLVVKNSGNSGLNSLRKIVECAPDGSTITYDQPMTTQSLLTAPLTINKNLTIQGAGPTDRPEITVPSTGLTITSSKVLTLEHVDIKSTGTAAFSGMGTVIIEGTTEGKN